MFYREIFNYLRVITVLLLTILAFSIVISGQSKSKTLNANELIYVLEPIIAGENGQFRVDLYFKRNKNGTSKLLLPLEWGGHERLYR